MEKRDTKVKKAIKITGLILALCTSLCTLAACGGKNADKGPDTNMYSSDKKSIVCTIFPEYDWVKEVIGDKADDFEITLLLDNGTDIHSYQPTAADLVKIASCDVFIYVGGESDKWVEDALSGAVNKDMQVVNLLDVLGDSVKEEELVEGMEAEKEEEGEGEEEEGPEYDEHVWLSLKNTGVFVDAIASCVTVLDPANAPVYEGNAKAYNEKLKELDDEYADAVNKASVKTVLFADRFPFRYLVDDYGLDYFAAFEGCSAETEASFETVTFLSGKVDELDIGAVLVIESSDKKMAETIISNTKDKDREVLVLDSMQSVTGKDIENGITYLGVMKDNLEVLKKALK